MKSQVDESCSPPNGRHAGGLLLSILQLGQGFTRSHGARWMVLLLVFIESQMACWAGNKGVVAAGHPLATEAGLNAMKRGGNAVDAAVAVGLTLGVVDGFNSGIGGGCFILIHTPRGECVAIDGREAAPMAAHGDMYLRDGEAVPELSQKGPLAVGVPGALAAFDVALKRYGRLDLKDLLLPAAQIAEHGFEINPTFYRRIASVVDDLKESKEIGRIFLTEEGKPFDIGQTFAQKDLAQFYRVIASRGIDYFYRGPIAEAFGNWMADIGGLITKQDMERYQPVFRNSVRIPYREFEVMGFPPPSSGGVHVAQILNILESYDIGSMDRMDAEWIHLVVEAMKLAFADRAYWLGDSDYADVPLGLTDPGYGEQLARRIRSDKAAAVPSHAVPPHAGKALFGSHTTHYSAADAEGWWVACTATVNTTLGAKVIVPGTGLVLNNEMDDFSAQPGKPNFFGLLGSEANSVQPGKRPLSSMSPTIVTRDGKPFLSLGAAGGPTIISQTLVHLLLMLDFGLDVDEALAHPRFHHQWKPDRIVMEKAWPTAVIESLRSKGHIVEVVSSLGAAQAVQYSFETKTFSGASDPRIDGEASSW
jgi:gamma-glutamyltranspeptidase/glutathione hydrolase